MHDDTTRPHFVVCVANPGCEDLQVRRLYRVLADPDAEAHGLTRVVDDSGEDYLYPTSSFLPVPLPEVVEQALAATA